MNPTILLAILVLFITTVAGQEPEIVDEIWPEVKPVGRTARLNCTVARKGNNKVIWQHINTKEIISTDESIDLDLNPIEGGKRKYEVQRRGGVSRVTYMLIIRRLRQQNAGRYRCYVFIANIPSTAYPSKIGSLTVQVAPSIRPGDTSTVLVVDQGGNSNLTCSATGIPYPNITWVRLDGHSLPTGGFQFRGAILPLMHINLDMGGVYRCVADNNIKPPAEHQAVVRVFHPPRTYIMQDSYGQAQGRQFDLKLECVVEGFPEPNVIWERKVEGGRQKCTDNQKFVLNKQTTDNQNLMSGQQWYSLKILNVQANDYTTYYCIAENTKGAGSSSTLVFETAECQGPNCQSPGSTGKGTSVKMGVIVLISSLMLQYLIP